MLPIAVKGGGICSATVPDVCKTPPPPPGVPIPYPNIGQNAMASGGTCTKKVKVTGLPSFILNTEIPLTNGDNPGVLGGVKSGTFMKKVQCIEGSSKVIFEGKGAVTLTMKTKHNNGNTLGIVAAPGQVLVLAAK